MLSLFSYQAGQPILRVSLFWRCMELLLTLLIALLGPGEPGNQDGNALSDAEQVRLDEALQEALVAYTTGQEVDPFEAVVEPTWYDPALGGINCNGDCARVGPSYLNMLTEDWYYRGAACPPELPRYTEIIFKPRFYAAPITVTCVDGGNSIVIKDDGVIRLDLLRDEPVWRDQYTATVYLPGAIVHHFTTADPTIAFVAETAQRIDAPRFECPIWSCDRDTVLMASLDEETGHWGVDLWMDSTRRVSAPADGLVTFVGEYNGCGQQIVLELDDEWWMRFCHLSGVVVAEGESVEAGQTLGYTGESGITEGRHLHLEIYDGLVPYDYFSPWGDAWRVE